LKSKSSPLHSPLGSLLLDSHNTTKAKSSPIQATYEPQLKLRNSTEYNITGSHVASLSANESEHQQDPVRESQHHSAHLTPLSRTRASHFKTPLPPRYPHASFPPKNGKHPKPQTSASVLEVVRSRDTHPTPPPSPLTTLLHLARHRPSQVPFRISSTLSRFPPASLRASPPSLDPNLNPKFSHVHWCFFSCVAVAGLAPRWNAFAAFSRRGMRSVGGV